MEEKNELNDIILNKNSKNNSTKKVLLTIATFSIILIIVVIIMNQVSGTKESALPHAPQVSEVVVEEVVQEPEIEVAEESVPVIEKPIAQTSELIEEDVVVEEATTSKSTATAPDGKDETERIFEEVFEEPQIVKEPDYTTTTQQKSASKSVSAEPVQKVEPKQVLKPQTFRPSGKYDPKSKSVVKTETPTTVESGQYYIQVGSFAKYAPSETFLDKIADRGYTYTFHKVTRSGKTLNKVLVGPFKTQSAAREALPVIRSSVESGAFLIKL
ncbi:MAG: SPOR domain-containing protein [Sulfurimonadaceae bacterium]